MSANPGPVPPRCLDLRKYPNRRYYDSTHSRHMTLEEIRSLIRDGYDIKVTDSKSGADLTAQVLTQLILELDTPKLESFPVPLLLRIIRVNDQWVRDFIETYFNQAFRAYLEYQEQLEERMRQWRGLSGNLPSFSPWAHPLLAPFTPAASPPAGASPAPNAAPPSPPPDLPKVVADLQRQVAALERQLARRRPAQPAPRRLRPSGESPG